MTSPFVRFAVRAGGLANFGLGLAGSIGGDFRPAAVLNLIGGAIILALVWEYDYSHPVVPTVEVKPFKHQGRGEW